MRQTHRIAGVLVVLAVMAVLFAGCSGSNAPTLPSPDGPGAGNPSAGFNLISSTGGQIQTATIANFKVEEKAAGAPDGEYQTAKILNLTKDFSTSSGQYNVVLVLDHSGSMGYGPTSKLQQMKEAARQFVDLMRPADNVEIVLFDDEWAVLQPFTLGDSAGKTALKAAIDSISWGGATAAWSAAQQGVDDLIALTRTGRDAVMLMTDGEDNSSIPDSATALANLITSAKGAGIPVYCVGFQAPDDAVVDLQRLADNTGALAWFPFDAASIAAAFAEFSEAVQGGYHIYWRSRFNPGDLIDARITYTGPGGPIVINRTNMAVPSTGS